MPSDYDRVNKDFLWDQCKDSRSDLRVDKEIADTAACDAEESGATETSEEPKDEEDGCCILA